MYSVEVWKQIMIFLLWRHRSLHLLYVLSEHFIPIQVLKLIFIWSICRYIGSPISIVNFIHILKLSTSIPDPLQFICISYICVYTPISFCVLLHILWLSQLNWKWDLLFCSRPIRSPARLNDTKLIVLIY